MYYYTKHCSVLMLIFGFGLFINFVLFLLTGRPWFTRWARTEGWFWSSSKLFITEFGDLWILQRKNKCLFLIPVCFSFYQKIMLSFSIVKENNCVCFSCISLFDLIGYFCLILNFLRKNVWVGPFKKKLKIEIYFLVHFYVHSWIIKLSW